MEIKDALPTQEVTIFDEIAQYEHEQVVFCQDPATGLRAVIGIHSTALGPAIGGTRLWTYEHDAAAITDVLRLSRGMTYKNAIAGLNHGGGKAVILGDGRTQKTEVLLRRFGRFVHSLGGKYITAEDVGMSTADMEYIAMETPYVSGKPESMGGGGDPSPVTAYSTYMGMKAAAKRVYGHDSLANRRVSVQGAGHVGVHLVGRLVAEGAHVLVSDIYEGRLRSLQATYPQVEVVAPDDIYDLDVDIYAPCALGATLNDHTLERLRCQIVAGAANNQLQDEKRHGDACRDRGILYAPDFLINCGGVINVALELTGYNRQRAYEQAEKVYDITLDIFRRAETLRCNNQEAALQLARERIEQVSRLRTTL